MALSFFIANFLNTQRNRLTLKLKLKNSDEFYLRTRTTRTRIDRAECNLMNMFLGKMVNNRT